MSEAVAEARKEPELNRAAVTMLVASLVTTMIGPFLYWALTMRLDTLLAMILLVAPSVIIVFGAVRLLTIQQKPELLTLGTAAFDVVKNLLVTAYVCCGFLQPATMRSMRRMLLPVSVMISELVGA